jgi:hypothetical protein
MAAMWLSGTEDLGKSLKTPEWFNWAERSMMNASAGIRRWNTCVLEIRHRTRLKSYFLLHVSMDFDHELRSQIHGRRLEQL